MPRAPWSITAIGILTAVQVASSATVSQLTAQHRAGQTFLIWTVPAGPGWNYRVYRSATPIADATSLDAATLAGSVGDSTWKDRRLSQLRGQTFAYRLDSLGAELLPTQAVCVVTPAVDRISYYAVTAQAAAGSEDRV